MRTLRGLRNEFFIPGSCQMLIYGSPFCGNLLDPFGSSRAKLEKQDGFTPIPGRNAVLLANLGPVAPKKNARPASMDPHEVKRFVEREWKRDDLTCESLLFFLEEHSALTVNKMLCEHLARTNVQMQSFITERVIAYDIHYGECVHLAIFSSVRFRSTPPPRA